MVSTVTLTSANTEYSIELPANTKAYAIKCRDAAVAYRWANVTGKVASPTGDYVTMGAGTSFSSPPLSSISKTGLTLYFASGTAGAVIEVVSYK